MALIESLHHHDNTFAESVPPSVRPSKLCQPHTFPYDFSEGLGPDIIALYQRETVHGKKITLAKLQVRFIVTRHLGLRLPKQLDRYICIFKSLKYQKYYMVVWSEKLQKTFRLFSMMK